MNTSGTTGQKFTNKVSNIKSQAVQQYNSSSTIGKIIFFIVLFILVIFIIYLIYNAVTNAQNASANAPVIVNTVIDAYVARNPVTLPQVTQGLNQSFSTWIYISDWNYNFGNYKNILWKGNVPQNTTSSSTPPAGGYIHSPSLWLYPLSNSLKVVTSTTANSAVESCDIQNIPLMSWVHIVYVLNNRTVDIYINGLLERSCALLGIPILTNDPVYMTQGNPAGFYGKLGKTIYFTYPLLPNQVANLYQQGPIGSNQYQIQFFQNGQFVSINNASNFS